MQFVSLEGLTMAPVGSLHRLVFGGRLFDKESWSCSVNVGGTPDVNLAASTFQAAISAWVGGASSQISSAARLDFIKFNSINPVTGRYILAYSNEILQNDMAIGAKVPAPGQNTVAISLRTALARGRAHAGRFYAPTGAITITGTDGRISGIDATSLATAARAMVNGINTALAGQGQVVVFSKIGQSVQPVTAIRVGRVIDTMRSRRASLPEDASQVNL